MDTYTQKTEIFKELLLKWQKKINLISPETIPCIQERHIDDSKSLLSVLPNGGVTIVDIGSGAGFPGIILGIYGYTVHLVDSDYRKCAFLNEAVRLLELKNTFIHNCRIDDYRGPTPNIVTSRALAPLHKLLDFLKIVSRETICSGFFHKGEKWEDEIKEAEKKWIFDKEVFTNPVGGVILKIENVRSII